MIIDVTPGLARLLAGHLPTGSALATGLALTGAGIAVGTGAACAVRASALRRLWRRARRRM